jgi:hypothetical protein
VIKTLVVLLAVSGFAGRALPVTNSTPFWDLLSHLTPEERGNACIDIELDRGQPEPVRALARRIERFWNNGQPESALARFPELAAALSPSSAAVGVTWRRPIPSPPMGFDPVRISARDSCYLATFEVDQYDAKHFFSILALEGDGAGSRLSVNISTDLGRTWSETFILSGFSYRVNDASGRVMRDKFWVVHAGGSPTSRNHALWARKFRTDNGASDTFLNGSASFNFYNAPTRDTVKEIEVISSQLFANGAIYLPVLMASDSLHYFNVGVTQDTAWHMTNLPFVNAREGLDGCWNDGRLSADTSFLFVSYVGTADSIHILRCKLGGSWEQCRSAWCGPAGTFPRSTGIGCHRDTILCAYTYNGRRVRYQLRRGRQASWVYGEPPQDTTRGNGFADVNCQGGYIHMVFWQDPDIGFYTRRPYGGTTWETPRRLTAARASESISPRSAGTAGATPQGLRG